MITIYKSVTTGLAVLTEPIDGCWINAIDPTPQEIQWLQSLNIPPDYTTYPLDIDERARTERENGEVLIVLRIPYYQGQAADLPYTTLPLGIILNEHYLVTICKRENDILTEFASGRVRNLATAKRNRFVLRMLLSAASKYLVFLRRLTRWLMPLKTSFSFQPVIKKFLSYSNSRKA